MITCSVKLIISMQYWFLPISAMLVSYRSTALVAVFGQPVVSNTVCISANLTSYTVASLRKKIFLFSTLCRTFIHIAGRSDWTITDDIVRGPYVIHV